MFVGWIRGSYPASGLSATRRGHAYSRRDRSDSGGGIAQGVCTQFTLQYVEGVALELIVGQLVGGDHSPCSLLRDTGFRAGIRGHTRRLGLFDQTVVGGQQHVRTRRLGSGQMEGVERTVTSGTEIAGALSDRVDGLRRTSSQALRLRSGPSIPGGPGLRLSQRASKTHCNVWEKRAGLETRRRR